MNKTPHTAGGQAARPVIVGQGATVRRPSARANGRGRASGRTASARRRGDGFRITPPAGMQSRLGPPPLTSRFFLSEGVRSRREAGQDYPPLPRCTPVLEDPAMEYRISMIVTHSRSGLPLDPLWRIEERRNGFWHVTDCEPFARLPDASEEMRRRQTARKGGSDGKARCEDQSLRRREAPARVAD